jgi:putative hydrolase of the HAD superfamily
LIKTVVFDFGNVIGYFDYHLTLNRLTSHTDMSAAALLAAFQATQLGEDYEAGRISTPDFLQRFRQIGNLRCEDSVLVEAWSDIFWPNAEVCALLPVLKPRYRLLLGSNTNELHADRFRQDFAEPLRYFDALVLSHEIGHRKPGAGFFAHCQQLAGCAPEKCLFIDDLPANVAGATALGWQAIVYTTFPDLRRRLIGLGIVS